MIKIAVHHADDNGDIITLLEDLTVRWQDRIVTVPTGFQSDGCSVPEFLWNTVSPQIDPRTLRGAIVHDYLYRNCPADWVRKDADKLFYDTIKADGFPGFKAYLAYIGVRWFGGKNWRGSSADAR